MQDGKNCLCPVKLGFSFGLIWGLGWFLLGIAGWLWGYGLPMITVMQSVYLGYGPSFIGAIVGGVLGFIDCFIFVFLSVLIYNCSCSKCCKKTS